MATNNPPSPNSNKRKRPTSDVDPARSRTTPATNGNEVPDDMYSSLLANLQGHDSQPQDETSRTAAAALQQQQSNYPEPNIFDHATAAHGGFQDPTAQMQQSLPQHPMQSGGQSIFDARQQSQQKPQVGSTAWHQMRKDNHKEVERRRREVINEGIENIAKMIPSSDKNKGAVLQNACRYIAELQAKITDFDNERNVFEITQQELTRRNETLRDSAQRAWEETAKWMGRCREAGLQFDDYDSSIEAQEALNPETAMPGVNSDLQGDAVEKAEGAGS